MQAQERELNWKKAEIRPEKIMIGIDWIGEAVRLAEFVTWFGVDNVIGRESNSTADGRLHCSAFAGEILQNKELRDLGKHTSNQNKIFWGKCGGKCENEKNKIIVGGVSHRQFTRRSTVTHWLSGSHQPSVLWMEAVTDRERWPISH